MQNNNSKQLLMPIKDSHKLSQRDESFMSMALKLADSAFEQKEIPVGCIIVYEDKIIGKGFNQVQSLKDCTAHAEMLAITSACNFLGGKYLQQCEMYVTLEPCVMCCGAIKWAQLSRLIYGAADPQRGFSSSVNVHSFFPSLTILSGIGAHESEDLLMKFFKSLRTKN